MTRLAETANPFTFPELSDRKLIFSSQSFLPNAAYNARASSHVGTKHLLALLDAWRPVARLTPAMGNCNDTDDFSVTPKDERIREPSQGYAPVSRVQFLAERRKLDEDSAEAFDFKKEVAAQSLELALIVFGCFC